MDFLKYYLRTSSNSFQNFNWTWASLLFVFLMLRSAINGSPMFYVLSLIPSIMLIYNIVTEWNVFKNNGISSKLMAYVFYGTSFLILILVCVALTISGHRF